MANAHLEDMRQRSLHNRSLADGLIGNMSVEQLGWSPAPKSWSPVEVLDHMNNAAEKYHVLVRRTIERSRERGLQDSASFRPGWLQRWFVNQIEPKANTRPLPAPGAFRPIVRQSVDTHIRDRFFELCNSLQELLSEADGVALTKLRFASPVSPLLRFNLGEAFWLLVAHEHRHLLQIQRLCANPQYPRLQ